MAYLRDTFGPEFGKGMPDPVSGREDFLIAAAYVAGWRDGKSLDIGVSTEGRTLRIHNLTANTRSAPILRASLATNNDVVTAIRAQLDAMSYWEQESDGWGGDPWRDQDYV